MRYEIRIENDLDHLWSGWFDGMQINHEPGGVTVITVPVSGQAALDGLLTRVRDLGVPLISVRRVDGGEELDHNT